MGNNPVSNIDPNGCAYTGYGSLSDMYYRAYYSDFTGHGGHLGTEREIYFRRNDQTVSTARIDELISSRFTNEISCYSLFGDWKAEKIKTFYKMQEDLARKAEMDKILAYLNEPGPKENSEAMKELAMMLQNASKTGLSFGGPGGGGYNIDKAIAYLNANAYASDGPNKHGKGQCSPFVPNAINAGFGDSRIPTNLAGSAYGPSLLNAGFIEVDIENLDDYSPIAGDIAVMNGPTGGKTCLTGINGLCGHIQMYNGEQWVSDFFQTREFWLGAAYANNTPQLDFKIYRWINYEP